MTGITVKHIREGFYYSTLDRQLGLPSYSTINSVQTLLGNIKKSQLGGVQYDLLGLVLNDDLFLNLPAQTSSYHKTLQDRN